MNIGKKIIQIKAKAKERTFIIEEELLKLVDEITNETEKAIIRTMFYTGLRIGEAVNLTFDDVNLDDNYIYVRKSKSRYERKYLLVLK